MKFVFKSARRLPNVLVIATVAGRHVAIRHDQVMSISMNEGYYKREISRDRPSAFTRTGDSTERNKLGTADILLFSGNVVELIFNEEVDYLEFIGHFKSVVGECSYLSDMVS